MKYLLHCPKCKATFDVSKQLFIWRDEFFDKLNILIKELKENQNHRIKKEVS